MEADLAEGSFASDGGGFRGLEQNQSVTDEILLPEISGNENVQPDFKV